jgi:hypothetical protein
MTDELNKLYNSATNTANAPELLCHVRFEGRSRDIALDLLGVTAGSSDDAIKTAVAKFMEVSPQVFTSTVIERHANGNLTLRPEAVFG